MAQQGRAEWRLPRWCTWLVGALEQGLKFEIYSIILPSGDLVSGSLFWRSQHDKPGGWPPLLSEIFLRPCPSLSWCSAAVVHWLCSRCRCCSLSAVCLPCQPTKGVRYEGARPVPQDRAHPASRQADSHRLGPHQTAIAIRCVQMPYSGDSSAMLLYCTTSTFQGGFRRPSGCGVSPFHVSPAPFSFGDRLLGYRNEEHVVQRLTRPTCSMCYVPFSSPCRPGTAWSRKPKLNVQNLLNLHLSLSLHVRPRTAGGRGPWHSGFFCLQGVP